MNPKKLEYHELVSMYDQKCQEHDEALKRFDFIGAANALKQANALFFERESRDLELLAK